MTRPLVAIVGRPNVGKSTLFNRLIGERLAIVEDLPGTTRDRIYGTTDWNGRTFTLIDTGGLALGVADEFGARIREQVRQAIEEADVIVFLVDAIDGLTAEDYAVADMLRTTNKPVVLGANKADNLQRGYDAVEFYNLGLGEPIPLSSIHGTGTGDLLDEIVRHLPPPEGEEAEETTSVARVAIVGRPNVGKSSIVNAILGQERVMVSEIPGTTRDAIDTLIEHNGQPILLIDTAGIRRRGRIDRGVEKYSVLRAMRALDRADIAVVVLDAVDGLTAQDTHVIGYALDAFRGIVVAINKWDLIVKDDRTLQEYTRRLRAELRFLDWAPLVFISAVTRQRLSALLDVCLRVKAARDTRIPTGQLNQVVQEAYRKHNPPSQRGKHLKLLYATQTDTDPPTFVFFVNDPELVHFSYKRFLENELRAAFGFEGTPLKLYFRARDEKRPD